MLLIKFPALLIALPPTLYTEFNINFAVFSKGGDNIVLLIHVFKTTIDLGQCAVCGQASHLLFGS